MKYLIAFLFLVQVAFSQNIKLDLSGKTGYFNESWSTHNFSSEINMVIFFDEGTIYYFETYNETFIKYYTFEAEDVSKKSNNQIYHIDLTECKNCDNSVYSFDINLNNMQLFFNYGSYSEIWYISDYELLNNNKTNDYINNKLK